MKTVIDKSGKPFNWDSCTAEETAALLNKSVSTIYRWVREGYLETDSQIDVIFSRGRSLRMAFSITAIDKCARKFGIQV